MFAPLTKSGKSWRFETMRGDFGEVMQIAKRIRDSLGGRFVLQGHLLNRSLPFITAAAIRPGMVMATEDLALMWSLILTTKNRMLRFMT